MMSIKLQKKSQPSIVVILTMILLLAPAMVHAQDREKRATLQNAVYGSVGFAGLYGYVGGAYERMVTQSTKNTYWVEVGAGAYGGLNEAGGAYFSRFSMITGTQKHHLEMSLGLVVLYNKKGYEDQQDNWSQGFSSKPEKSDFWLLRPGGVIGYRFQKPGSHFLFRTGFGFPESFYLGIGVLF